MTKNELYHHGVIGMRWGIRRYQNPDGSLTEEGRRRYEEIYKSQRTAGRRDEYQRQLETKKKEKGIRTIDEKHDVVKKGSIIKRICDSNEPIDDRVKYASILDNDSENYIDTARNDGLAWSPNRVQKQYRLKKDLNVAPADMVRDYIMNQYGDTKLSDYKEYVAKMFGEKAAKEMAKKYGDIPINKVYDPQYGDDVFNALQYNKYKIAELGKSKVDHIIQERVAVGRIVGQKILRDHVYSNGQDIYEHFRKQGYDAIVDAEDLTEELFDYPIIVLNPKETLTYVSEKKI